MATPVEQIKQRLSIVDVVSSYVSLQRAGKSLKGKSPFTNERTPSFFVSPDRGTYYCFSSGKGGDIFTFIGEMEGVDFKGALKILAERAGVELVAVDPAARDTREKLFSLLADATHFFLGERKKTVSIVEYLHTRGLKEETIEKWCIGYAPPGWRNLKEHLNTKGYPDALIFQAGLLKKPDAGGAGYDVFRDRVMFPIADASGRVVGFSGRIFGQDPAAPKYVNSPETELFLKSHVLFGYDKAKQGIRTYDFSLVVEGQFDLVLAHQAGYTNTVALSGTALSLAHVELLQRLSNNVVLALDADTAGIASAKRSAVVMLTRGMDVKIARILGGKDPADLVRENPKLLKQAVGGAQHIVEFLLAVLRTATQDDRAYKLRVREEVLPFIGLMPNHIDQEHFADIVAKDLGVTTDAIRYEVTRITETSKNPQGSQGVQTPSRTPTEKPVQPKRIEDILEHLYGILLWQEGEDAQEVNPEDLRKNLEFVLGHASMQSLLDWSPERKNEAIFKAETVYTEATKEGLPRALSEMLQELYLASLRQRLATAREQLRTAEETGNDEEKTRALGLCSEINELLKDTVGHNRFSHISLHN